MSQQLGNNAQHSEVKLVAGNMKMGEQLSGQLCPNCRGGATKEGSLSLTRTGNGVAYFCHRDKCNWKGHIPMIAMVRDMEDRNKIPNCARKFYGRMEALPDSVISSLIKKYALSEEDITRAGWIWAPDMDGGRIQMPIYNRFKFIVGHSFRTMDKRKLPKNRIVLTDTVAPMLSWYKSPMDKCANNFGWIMPLVLVEDQISALRVSKYTNAVALLGTNLSEAKVLEIIKARAPMVVLALDEDAKATAIKYTQKYAELFKSFKMIHLKYDLKDISDEEIKKAIAV